MLYGSGTADDGSVNRWHLFSSQPAWQTAKGLPISRGAGVPLHAGKCRTGSLRREQARNKVLCRLGAGPPIWWGCLPPEAKPEMGLA